jgi:phasin family protein
MQMTQTFDDAGKFGKEFIDTGLESFIAVARDAQAISGEASNYARQVFEEGASAAQKLLSAKSIEKAIEIQTDYAKQAYEAFVAEGTRMSRLYADLAKDAYRPFESLVAKAK